MWKVYTKTGDAGLTSNANNERIPKNSSLITLQGDIDEVNAQVGLLRSIIKKNELLKNIDTDLKIIQHSLFTIGSEVSFCLEKSYITEDKVTFLEERIDYMLKISPKINSFVYPTGSVESSLSQVIRTIVRRCERDFVSFLESLQIDNYPSSYQYINRLSDYFFTLSIYINFLSGVEEEPLIF